MDLRVLVAEDEDHLLDLFVTFLRGICKKVTGVANGKKLSLNFVPIPMMCW